MSSHEAKLDGPRRLADVLATGHACSLREALLCTLQLARQVGCLHEAGRVHLGIAAEAVTLEDRQRPKLPPAAEQVRFGGEAAGPDLCPPELAEDDAVELPTVIEAAAAVLRQSGHTIDPRQIDLYQLGTLLYRLLTGQSILQYMYTPAGKTEVPDAVRTILERMLGYDADDRYGDCPALIAALEDLARQVGAEASGVPGTETPPSGSFIAGPSPYRSSAS